MSFKRFIGFPGFREDSGPEDEYMHLNFYDGGLGDHIARLPAVQYLLDEYPFLYLTVWCPKFFVEFGKQAVPGAAWREYQTHKPIPMTRYPLNAGSINGVTSLRSHLVDHAFMRIVDKQVPIEKRNYIQVKPIEYETLKQRYVVVTTGFTAAVREFKPQVVNEIVDFIKSKDCEVVFLGSKEATVGAGVQNIKGEFSKDIDFSKGVDLRNKTTISEAHAIIAKSKAIVGLDNGLLHLAGCTQVPIIAGYTTVDPIYRMPYRNNELGWNTHAIVPETSLKCRFCQSNMNFVYDFDFRNCYYDDFKCIKDQTAAPYIKHLEKLI